MAANGDALRLGIDEHSWTFYGSAVGKALVHQFPVTFCYDLVHMNLTFDRSQDLYVGAFLKDLVQGI